MKKEQLIEALEKLETHLQVVADLVPKRVGERLTASLQLIKEVSLFLKALK